MSNYSLFTTQPFEFRIEDERFFVPSGLISRFSLPLDCLIWIEMKEKIQGYAVLKDVTAPTFDRFLEWATKGFYTPPSPSVDSQTEHKSALIESSKKPNAKGVACVQEDNANDSEDTDDDTADGNTSSEEGDSSYEGDSSSEEDETASTNSLLTTKKAFYNRKSLVRRDAIRVPPPDVNLTAEESFRDVFLCHAQLYVFADAQDIQELKLLALDELYAVLTTFKLYPKRTGDVIDLLRYVYANTISPSQGVEPLRKMISNYVAFKTDILNKDERFAASMLEDGGDMLRDYMSCVSKNV